MSFHGEAPIAGLTPQEVEMLMLGHHVHQESAEDAAQTNESNPDLRKRKQDLRRGHRNARREQFGDLGFQ